MNTFCKAHTQSHTFPCGNSGLLGNSSSQHFRCSLQTSRNKPTTNTHGSPELRSPSLVYILCFRVSVCVCVDVCVIIPPILNASQHLVGAHAENRAPTGVRHAGGRSTQNLQFSTPFLLRSVCGAWLHFFAANDTVVLVLFRGRYAGSCTVGRVRHHTPLDRFSKVGCSSTKGVPT